MNNMQFLSLYRGLLLISLGLFSQSVCAQFCDCEEFIYLNETTTGGSVLKFKVEPDSTLTQVGNPWFDNQAQGEDLVRPHGLAIDLNGFLYVGEDVTSSSSIRKLDCQGNIFPETGTDGFEIPSGTINMGSIGNSLFVNGAAGGAGGPGAAITQYDICTQSIISEVQFCENEVADWGFYIDPRTEKMYATSSIVPNAQSYFWAFDINDFDNDNSTCVTAISLDNLPAPNARVIGLAPYFLDRVIK